MSNRQVPVVQLSPCVESQASASACACSLGALSRVHRQAQQTAAHHLAEVRLSSCPAGSNDPCPLDPGLPHSPQQARLQSLPSQLWYPDPPAHAIRDLQAVQLCQIVCVLWVQDLNVLLSKQGVNFCLLGWTALKPPCTCTLYSA